MSVRNHDDDDEFFDESKWDGHIHVVPDFDNFDHIDHYNCPCWPTMIYKNEKNGKEVWSHNVVH